MDQNWLEKLGRGLDTPQSLVDSELWPGEKQARLEKLHANFRIRVPEAFQGRLRQSPSLWNQVIPQEDELFFRAEELEDPIGDETHSPVPGLTHRYPDRVLLKLGHHCAMYCRFCFRRTTVSKTPMIKRAELEAALNYIRARPEIWEVILTGGDPLVYPDAVLQNAFEQLGTIRHLRCLRFHTRIPTALPERITAKLLQSLKNLKSEYGIQPWLVAHINSPEELTPSADRAIDDLLNAGIPLLSQSVLLKGVNDSQDVLETLFRALVSRGVKPYYLHYPDLAQGTHHFRIPLDAALHLVNRLRSRISGTCIPHFMLDLPGGLGKVAISGETLQRIGPSTWHVKRPQDGTWITVTYPE